MAWEISYSRREAVRFSGIDYLVHHLVADQRVQAVGSDKVDPEIEPP